MIRLLELFPEHLNLNGDRGNLVVIQRRLEWAGAEVQSFTYRLGQPLPSTRPDFVLIGHGSPAAWRQIYANLAKITPVLHEWLEQGTQVLAVASGFAALHGLLPGLPASIARAERKSVFVAEPYEENELVGYLNSDLDLANLVINENFIGTNLHGPLLGKNVWLADLIISKFDFETGAVDAQKFELVNSLAEKAGELAKELSRE
jgi:CobQ-like glutamine amidotransferase family enzyme